MDGQFRNNSKELENCLPEGSAAHSAFPHPGHRGVFLWLLLRSGVCPEHLVKCEMSQHRAWSGAACGAKGRAAGVRSSALGRGVGAAQRDLSTLPAWRGARKSCQIRTAPQSRSLPSLFLIRLIVAQNVSKEPAGNFPIPTQCASLWRDVLVLLWGIISR